jgi:dolichyl-diphosphooligosaccharide--protein glycosyltransferase
MGVCTGTCRLLGWLCAAAVCSYSMWHAYNVRLFAIRQYGPIIHEFDPYFNYRAAEHLATHGMSNFFHWFDHLSWYPLGRPVGTTIYPGPQLAAVAIWRGLQAVPEAFCHTLDHLLHRLRQHWQHTLPGDFWQLTFTHAWSLVEVCCYIPAWLGVVASIFVGLLAAECADSVSAGVVACYVMALLPAHAQRSVGGGFDNEAVAVAPMCAALYFWSRALRPQPRSAPRSLRLPSFFFALLSGCSYAAMAASWGGYVFAVNVIAAHALLLLFLSFGSSTASALYAPYSIFFLVGTALASQVPVVGWTPIRSLEHIIPVATFLLLQLLAVCAVLQPRAGRTLAAVVAAAAALSAAAGWAGMAAPASARVRALFGAHATRTGNPLVDSVSEHQPATSEAYDKYLQVTASCLAYHILLYI